MIRYKKHALSHDSFQLFPQIKRLKNSSLIAVLMMPLLSISLSVKGSDGLDREQNVLSSCNALKVATNNAKALPCINYIEGFLSGVLNANNTGVANLLEANRGVSTLVKRAYTTRVGNKARNRAASKTINDTCLSISESRKLIIENLSNSSLSTISSLEQLNARLVHVLKTACATESKSE